MKEEKRVRSNTNNDEEGEAGQAGSQTEEVLKKEQKRTADEMMRRTKSVTNDTLMPRMLVLNIRLQVQLSGDNIIYPPINFHTGPLLR